MSAARRSSDLTVQLSSLECDAHTVTGADLGRVAHDRGAIRVPADGIPSREDGERAQILQASRENAEPRVGELASADGRGAKAFVGRTEPSAADSEATAEIAGRQTLAKRAKLPLAPGDPCEHRAAQLVRELGRIPSVHRQPRRPPGKTALRRQ